MGLIRYIMRERERRFRAMFFDSVCDSCTPPAVKWDFINGNDNALSEIEEYRAFREWQSGQGLHFLKAGG